MKKFINILALLYLVAAVLLYLNILDVGQQTNPDIYFTLFLIGAILLLLELIVENLYLASLKRGHAQEQKKINELKASLYDHQQEIQSLRNKQTAEAAAASSRPAATTAPPSGYTTSTAPITAAPTGTEPVPPVVKPADPPHNPNVIITPSPTPGIQDPERRLPENTDS